uniref:hypothetical protein n=1 Tax=Prosthecobacter sp. TaxID=1965333 RepID=UPI0037851C7D
MQFALGQLYCTNHDVPPLAADSARSYDWKGHRYEWLHEKSRGSRICLDVEGLDTPAPDAIVPHGMNTRDFWAAWTFAEACCKISDVPILQWIRTLPLVVPRSGVVLQMPVQFPSSSSAWSFTDCWPEQNVVFTCAWLQI